MTSEAWADRLKIEVRKADREEFLTDLQALIKALREGKAPQATPALRRHATLAIDYMDDGHKKEIARKLLRNP